MKLVRHRPVQSPASECTDYDTVSKVHYICTEGDSWCCNVVQMTLSVATAARNDVASVLQVCRRLSTPDVAVSSLVLRFKSAVNGLHKRLYLWLLKRSLY